MAAAAEIGPTFLGSAAQHYLLNKLLRLNNNHANFKLNFEQLLR